MIRVIFATFASKFGGGEWQQEFHNMTPEQVMLANSASRFVRIDSDETITQEELDERKFMTRAVCNAGSLD